MKAHLDEGQIGEVMRNQEELGIVDIDDLIPWDTSEILKPERLMKLSISQLKHLLRSDDFNDADMKLIREILQEIKKGGEEQKCAE